MKKIFSFLGKSGFAGTLAAAALFAGTLAEAAPDLGKIVCIGDSITQANGSVASYRYALWKHCVDSGTAYTPLGSMSIFQNGQPASPVAADYLGKTFPNFHEGHYGWDVAWTVDGKSVGNRPNTGQNTGGIAEWSAKYGRQLKTATLLMGVNDLSRGNGSPTYSDEKIVENTKTLVKKLQKNAPRLDAVHVFSVLPSAQAMWGNGRGVPRPAIEKYNVLLKANIAKGSWNHGKTKVIYHDITPGFDPAEHTYDRLHPNAQGELVVASNIARALGLNQRTAGLNRRGNAELTKLSGASQHKWAGAKKGAHEFTFAATMKLKPGKTVNVICGNGETAGAVIVEESAIFWNGGGKAKLLYGQTADAYKDKFMSKSKKSLRVAWISARKNGAPAGFYVWLDDALIGEALAGAPEKTVAEKALANGAVVEGKAGAAEIELAYDAEKAWAPKP